MKQLNCYQQVCSIWPGESTERAAPWGPWKKRSNHQLLCFISVYYAHHSHHQSWATGETTGFLFSLFLAFSVLLQGMLCIFEIALNSWPWNTSKCQLTEPWLAEFISEGISWVGLFSGVWTWAIPQVSFCLKSLWARWLCAVFPGCRHMHWRHGIVGRDHDWWRALS